jgi:hypothetical protein
MFGSIGKLWREARGNVLLEELRDLLRRAQGLNELQAERYGRTAAKLSQDWDKKFGSIKKSDVGLRKFARSEFKESAKKKHYDNDIGVAYGYALFSLHIEASYTPGDDAEFAFSLSSQTISACVELDRKLGPYLKS